LFYERLEGRNAQILVSKIFIVEGNFYDIVNIQEHIMVAFGVLTSMQLRSNDIDEMLTAYKLKWVDDNTWRPAKFKGMQLKDK
jgi:hypothetical protein